MGNFRKLPHVMFSVDFAKFKMFQWVLDLARQAF